MAFSAASPVARKGALLYLLHLLCGLGYRGRTYRTAANAACTVASPVARKGALLYLLHFLNLLTGVSGSRQRPLCLRGNLASGAAAKLFSTMGKGPLRPRPALLVWKEERMERL